MGVDRPGVREEGGRDKKRGRREERGEEVVGEVLLELLSDRRIEAEKQRSREARTKAEGEKDVINRRGCVGTKKNQKQNKGQARCAPAGGASLAL